MSSRRKSSSFRRPSEQRPRSENRPVLRTYGFPLRRPPPGAWRPSSRTSHPVPLATPVRSRPQSRPPLQAVPRFPPPAESPRPVHVPAPTMFLSHETNRLRRVPRPIQDEPSAFAQGFPPASPGRQCGTLSETPGRFSADRPKLQNAPFRCQTSPRADLLLAGISTFVPDRTTPELCLAATVAQTEPEAQLS